MLSKNGVRRSFQLGLLGATALSLCPAAALAQDPAQPAAVAAQDAPPIDGVEEAANEDETIVVTGTSVARKAFDTPAAI